MELIGTGIDIVDIRRVERIYARYADAFAKKILTSYELNEFSEQRNKASFLAKRFAAKEAFVKALGTGITKKLNWKEIRIAHDDNGKPYIELSVETTKYNGLQHHKTHISIADEKNYAVAHAIILRYSH